MAYHETQIQSHQATRLFNQNYKRTGENILGDGVKLCRRAKWFNTQNPDTAFINVYERNGRYVPVMHDVATCGNGHLCPFCAGAMAAHNGNWIDEMLVPTVEAAGKTLSLLTLTAFHQRNSDWSVFSANFFLALSTFYKNMRRDFAAIGFVGRYRGVESPVGPNGLHLHPHDLIVHEPGADLETFKTVAAKKWRAALKKHGLRCNKNGLHLKEPGTFDPRYIAKEIASHDSKDKSAYGLVTLFELLSRSARGDKQAGEDWLRAAKALQGRDRWNVGQLAAKLGIPSPSDWKPERTRELPVNVITYPQAHHMHATSPSNPRPALAHILNAAARETRNPATVGRTADMAMRMCLETIRADLDELNQKHEQRRTTAEGDTLKLARLLVWHMQDIADYKRETHAKLFPAPFMIPLPPLWGQTPEHDCAAIYELHNRMLSEMGSDLVF